MDKSLAVAPMVRHGRESFLARPRKSGKTLGLSAANAMLSAKTDLFEGTKLMQAVDSGDPTVAHIAQLWKKNDGGKAGVPVLHLDFAFMAADPVVFKGALLADIKNSAASCLGLHVSAQDIPNAIKDIFQAIGRQGRRLAVLIDEYDQPIVKMLSQNGGKMDENVDANIEVMHEFFTALKSAFGVNGHCLLMTGVSKFSRVSSAAAFL